jgi:hypothetical protein
MGPENVMAQRTAVPIVRGLGAVDDDCAMACGPSRSSLQSNLRLQSCQRLAWAHYKQRRHEAVATDPNYLCVRGKPHNRQAAKRSRLSDEMPRLRRISVRAAVSAALTSPSAAAIRSAACRMIDVRGVPATR